MDVADDRNRVSRRFDYERRLLPSEHLAALEPGELSDLDSAISRSGLTVGYPAWNLLYYSLYCSLLPEQDNVVIETGTNRGASTVVMAQALKDLGTSAVVQTVDNDERLVRAAKRNVGEAGLSAFVRFNVADSRDFLKSIAGHVDFAFLDDHHTREHVVAEVDILRPKLAQRGKIYFDNTSFGGVAEALRDVRRKYGGNLVEFPNCSWSPPGNAIWQPD